ncbi:MAG: hypothetical protein ACLRZ9_07705 [Eubacterium sp.]
MKELYTSPKAEMIEFDAKDVITTSGFTPLDQLTPDNANNDDNWTPGLY